MLFQLFLLLFTTIIFLIFSLYFLTHKDSIQYKFSVLLNKIRYFLFSSSYKEKIIKKMQKVFVNNYIVYSNPTLNTNNKEFTVLSYNILAQRYLGKNIKLIKNLEIKQRLKSIIIEIKSTSPDIFCLQEVTLDVYKNYLLPAFDKEYSVICHNNEGSLLRNAFGIKKERFEILNESKIIICDNSKKGKNQSEEACSNSNNIDNNSIKEEKNEINYSNDNSKRILVDCNRGIINVTLKDKLVENTLLSVFCVHFPWKPIFEYQKARILGLIYDFIYRKNIPNVVIAGDFNSIPNSIVMRMVYYKDWMAEYNKDEKYIDKFIFNSKEITLNEEFTEKMTRRENFARTFNDLMNLSKKINDRYLLRSAYASYRQKETGINGGDHFSFLRNHPKYTNYTNKFCNTLDYIIYSRGLKKLKILKLPDIDKENIGFLPNEKHPSDHLKLVAHFEYVPFKYKNK